MTAAPVRRLQRHLVSVWNPAYAGDAMEATLEMLLGSVHAYRSGSIAEEEVYVWWGKVRSPNRLQQLVHLPEILSLDDELRGDSGPEREIHLYLTDYRSLYVGHVAEVTADDVREGEDEHTHVPPFYADRELSCDCWFRLFDVRRVVADDTPGVVDELRKLANLRYHGHPVSIYGGMVELPLIVARADGARWFEADVRERLIEGRFWVEFDAERAGVGHMEQELRENLFGEDAWNGLDPAARVFVATAEALFRAHRQDAAFDFGPVIVDLAKAFEVQANVLLRRTFRDAPAAERRSNVGGRTVDIASGTLWTLGELAHIIGEDEVVNRSLKRRLRDGEWFAASLPPILRELADVRNPAAHTSRVSRDTATELRNRVLGIGSAGTLVRLGKVREV